MWRRAELDGRTDTKAGRKNIAYLEAEMAAAGQGATDAAESQNPDRSGCRYRLDDPERR